MLGNSGATRAQIARAEERLAAALPPSYSSFLRVSNGWRFVDNVIDRLWPVEDIEWFSTRHGDWIDAWLGAVREYLPEPQPVPDEEYMNYGERQDSTLTFRDEYLSTALEISLNYPDTSVIDLLNPQIVTPEGEWEAWLFANWLHGARRYRSFADLMRAEYAAFVALRNGKC